MNFSHESSVKNSKEYCMNKQIQNEWVKQEQSDMNYPECSRSIQTICSLKYEYEKITLQKQSEQREWEKGGWARKGVEQTLYTII